eukprot:4936649-Pleurochrysis_carterae.AAC.2
MRGAQSQTVDSYQLDGGHVRTEGSCEGRAGEWRRRALQAWQKVRGEGSRPSGAAGGRARDEIQVRLQMFATGTSAEASVISSE